MTYLRKIIEKIVQSFHKSQKKIPFIGDSAAISRKASQFHSVHATAWAPDVGSIE